MEDKYFKYPKTWHFPWSRTIVKDDDRVFDNVDHFVGRNIVITEKMDGENTTFYRDHLHARSLDSKHHPSRDWVKAIHSQIKSGIPDGWRFCGENLRAEHAIPYADLPSYFMVFGVYNENNICLSWADTEQYVDMLGLVTVPVLYKGIWDEDIVKSCYTGKSNVGLNLQEGYVVRMAEEFPYDDFKMNVAKFVRKGHVAGSEHWTNKTYVQNKLKK